LLEIFELILTSKYFPEIWRKYSVILLRKPIKDDFRSISLALCVLKILEKMIKKRFILKDLLRTGLFVI